MKNITEIKITKCIALLLVFLFIFQSDFLLSFNKKKSDPEIQLELASGEFAEGRYDQAEKRLERLKILLNKQNKNEKQLLARATNLLKLIQQKRRIIVKEGRPKKNRKFGKTVLGVLAAAAVIVGIVVLVKVLAEYTLEVDKGWGVDGGPDSGKYTYKYGKTASYHYTLQSGYTKLSVKLDDKEVPAGGTIKMKKDHTLTVTASRQYTLTVTRGEGVDGSPDTGTYTYKEDDKVNYSYSLKSGYENLRVKVDGWTKSASGSITMSKNRTLTASASRKDYPPSVTIVNPANGSTVSDKLVIRAEASDDKGVRYVKFYIGGYFVDTDYNYPYRYTWNTASWSNGTYTIKAVAYDTEYQKGSAEITVTVRN